MKTNPWALSRLLFVSFILSLSFLFSTAHVVEAQPFAADAVRFLEQSTFGPTYDLIARVQQIGFEAFLDEQLAAPMSDYPELAFWPQTRPTSCTGDCQRDNYTYYQLQRHFFTNALYGPDQLRQRVAFALGQILVTSQVDVPLLQVSNAIKAFYDATVQLGVASQVTTFTLSDFSRTWVPNGTSGLTTRGAHTSSSCVVPYSAVNSTVCRVPTEPLSPPSRLTNGPDDTDEGGNARGRWIPTAAIDQYGPPSPPGLGYRTPILLQYFQISEDSANPTSDLTVLVLEKRKIEGQIKLTGIVAEHRSRCRLVLV